MHALHSLQLLDTAPEERFDRIARLAQALFGTPVVAVNLVDAERVWSKSCIGAAEREGPRATALCGHVVHAAAPLVVKDALEDPRFSDWPQVRGARGLRFYAGHPIRSMGQVVGTLCIADTRPRQLSTAEHGHLADLAALAEHELAACESATDSVTGLLNRRGFELVAQQCLNHTEREREAACLLFIDLEGLGQINGTLGREQADDAQRQFARCLTQSFRGSDVVARLGASEFVALLSAASLGDTAPAIERLQRHLDAAHRPGVPWRLSFSAGSSVVLNAGAAGLREALQRPDRQRLASQPAAGTV